MRETETKALLDRIKSVYPRVNINEFSVDIWDEILKNVTYDKCYKAFIKYATEGEGHDPKPGDILRIAKSTYESIEKRIKTPCDKCQGIGYVFLIGKDKHESVGMCDCQNGEALRGLPIVKLFSYNCDELGRVKI
ncbi:hypothetical protein [Acetobacterium bakii]|uniref:Uncharacterized protein n=1 Tax=Acetobacterium bakii TaxID=52689 RepID=A0A0L6TYX9_9FIRM|nr:hypothetical protein [Acetobacterium bakii]KNZ41448.1 hypothetical protein AKG39_11810 [Acetobacterium bakii]